jgi:hypothetical protein
MNSKITFESFLRSVGAVRQGKEYFFHFNAATSCLKNLIKVLENDIGKNAYDNSKLTPKSFNILVDEIKKNSPKDFQKYDSLVTKLKNDWFDFYPYLDNPVVFALRKLNTGTDQDTQMDFFITKINNLLTLSGKDLFNKQISDDASLHVVEKEILERLSTAYVISKRNPDPGLEAEKFIGAKTIRDFRKLTKDDQMNFINEIYNKLVIAIPFAKSITNMTDPEMGGTNGDKALHSSISPVNPGSMDFRELFPKTTPFKEYGIGFRTDGSGDVDKKRILDMGMQQQRYVPDLIKKKGSNLDGTIFMKNPQAFFWKGSYDIFNETAICISRSFLGATAFPSRESDGTFLLWAVDCSELYGCDVELIQSHRNRQWRPGEKAYQSIPKDNIYGWIEIERKGVPQDGGGWVVNISNKDWNQGPKWPKTDTPQKNYLQAILNAWKNGSYSIPGNWDFKD